MSASYLRLRFLREDDSTGELVAEAASDGFSGRSSAWFTAATIEDFARAIAVFPLAHDARPAIASGYGTPGRLTQEHLGITVYAPGDRGHIGVQVRMATPTQEPTQPESQNSVRIVISTTYEALARFSRQLLGVLNGSLDESQLDGDS